MARDTTRRRILATLRDGPLQARQVGGRLELEESAAYRQLEKLRGEDLVKAERVREGPGRPKKKYELTEDGWETFPRDYRLLLAALLDAIEAEAGRDGLEACLARIADELADGIAGGDDREERLEGVVDLYNELGFEAHLERGEDGLLLVQRNCPFRQIARSDPDALCEHLDEGIQRRAFPEAEVDLEGTMARGAHRCEHRVRFPASETDG